MLKFKIKRIIEERGISQRKLAEMTGINKSTMGRIINNEQDPHTDELVKIARVLQLDIEELFDEKIKIDIDKT